MTDRTTHLSPAELDYLRSQRLGRLATVGASGEPHVVPARFKLNEELGTIDVVGRYMGTSKKFRDATRNPKVAFVVDGGAGAQHPHGVEVRGTAQALTEGGEHVMEGSDPEFIRITPRYIVSWGIDGEPTRPRGRRVASR